MPAPAAYIYAEAVTTLSESGQGVAQRRRVRVGGIVQGVGFRPFVYGLARAQELGGFVRNDARGVVIEVEGATEKLDLFAAALVEQAPPLARIAALEESEIEPRGEQDFTIAQSADEGARTALVPADIATLRRLPARAFRSSGQALRLPVHQLHQLRTALHDHPLRPLRPHQHEHGLVRDVRGLPARV
jgi:acylphosphatase